MKLEFVRECPICNNQSFHSVLECLDHTASQEFFTIQACKSCNLHFTNPRPPEEDLDRYYQSNSYISHTGNPRNTFEKIYHLIRKYSLNWKYRMIARLKSPGQLLDYGCGTGEFLQKMESNDWEVFGIEPAKIPREKANSHLKNQDAVSGSISKLPKQKYDIITLWHVLEHVAELNKTLLLLKEQLKPDGLIFVAVPNRESPDAIKYKSHWAGYDVPRHLWHFSKSNLSQLLCNHQLEIDKTIPMKLDAYYVAWLSEKYKQGKPSQLRPLLACYNGLVSNFKAKKETNYSSHLYISRHA